MKTIALIALLFAPLTTFAKGPASFVKPYLEIQTLMAKDTFKGISEQAVLLAKALKAEHLDEAASLASPLKNAPDLAKARDLFEKLNAKLVPWFKKHPQDGAELAYCPMKKASWLQKKGDIQNPYYGAEMLECGVKEDER